jgi:hypothetical protein
MGYSTANGLLAQLVERFVYTEDVGGSSPSRPTIYPNYVKVFCQRCREIATVAWMRA